MESEARHCSEATSSLDAFDIQTQVRLVFGQGAVESVGKHAAGLGGRRVLLVTDEGIVRAGHAAKAIEHLQSAGLEVATFASVRENPTTADVDLCVEAARDHKTDLLVGLGGGSSIDTAKGCNFIFTNGGKMQDYWGIGKAPHPMLPLIAIPTTAGTGSECQSFALIADEKTHQKMACGDSKAAAAVAILDPELTLSQPRKVSACTGVDALSHAIESGVSLKRNAFSWMHSQEATKCILPGLERVLTHPEDLEARGQLLLGAALAGTAIENSMLGAAHATANPLTARFGVIHGMAVGVMLPHVMRLNAADPGVQACYAQLARLSSVSSEDRDDLASQDLIRAVETALEMSEIPCSLEQHGVTSEDLDVLAEMATEQWTGRFNPKSLSKQDFNDLYRKALEYPS